MEILYFALTEPIKQLLLRNTTDMSIRNESELNNEAIMHRLSASLKRYLEKKYAMKIHLNGFGKPVSDGVINFNISHSVDFIVCALSPHPVGIDAEKIIEDMDIIDRILDPLEMGYFNRNESKSKRLFLTRLWTMKESYLKMEGVGLTKDPRSIEILTEKTGRCKQFVKGFHFH